MLMVEQSYWWLGEGNLSFLPFPQRSFQSNPFLPQSMPNAAHLIKLCGNAPPALCHRPWAAIKQRELFCEMMGNRSDLLSTQRG